MKWWHEILVRLPLRRGRILSDLQSYAGLARAPLTGLDRTNEGGYDVMMIGILVFSILAGAVSLLIFKKHEALERAELSTYVALIAWGSLLFGPFMAKIPY